MASPGGSVNTTRVLRSVWLNAGISQSDVALKLDLNRSTVSKITATLRATGILEEASVGSAGPSGGRRPVYLRINPKWGSVIGVEAQPERINVVAITLGGEVFFERSIRVDLVPMRLLEQIAQTLVSLRPEIEDSGMPVLGVGMGLPGFVDDVSGTLRASMPLGVYEPLSVVDEVQRLTGFSCPIMVDNDANCGCWGELAFNHRTGARNVMFVLGEHRRYQVDRPSFRVPVVGIGFLIDGRVHRGRDYSAGEFQSTLQLVGEHVNQFSVSDGDAQRFLQDPAVDDQISYELAIHIAFLANLLDLDRVVLGGSIEKIATTIRAKAHRFLRAFWNYPNDPDVTIDVSRLGELSVAHGAAGMFLQRLITVPDVTNRTGGALCGVNLLNKINPLIVGGSDS